MMQGITAAEIATKLGYDIAGDGEITITGFSYAPDAGCSDLAIAFNKKEIENTKAQVVLSEPHLLVSDKTFIFFYEYADMALIKVAALMINKGIYHDYSIPPVYHLDRRGFMCGKNTVIGENTEIAPYVCIGDDVTIGNHVRIGEGVYIGSGTTIGDNVKIMSGAKIGASAFFHSYDDRYTQFVGVGNAVIGNYTEIGYNTVIQRGTLSDTVVGENCVIGNLVDIGHDCKIGCDCRIVSQSGIAGNVSIGNCVQIFGKAAIANNLTIEDHAIIKGYTAVTKNVRRGEVIIGVYGRPIHEEIKRRAIIDKILRKELK